MRTYCTRERSPLALVALIGLAACQPTDQQLPFELAPGQVADVSVGPNGGTVSLPPTFSIDFPAGALASAVNVTVQQRISAPFPSDAGIPVPGTAFDVGPSGTMLANPARVEIRIETDQLAQGDDVRMSVGVLQPDGTVLTYAGTFDLTNGVLSADVDRLGPIAAIISDDAIAVLAGIPDSLFGGSFPPIPPSPVGPAPGPEAAAMYGGVVFSAGCSSRPGERRCFSSGVVRLWADDVVTRRAGTSLFMLRPEISADLEFFDYDGSGVPQQVVGVVRIDGDLRARFNSVVTSYDLAESATTGHSTGAVPTSLTVSTSVLTFGETTAQSGTTVESEVNVDLEFQITGIGTSEMLILQAEAEIDFENSDGTTETGRIVAHLRLRS